MSSLQWGLLLAGVVVLLAVLSYNRWQVRRHAPKTKVQREVGAAAQTDDALLPESADHRREPVLEGIETPPLAPESGGGRGVLDPALDVQVSFVLEHDQISGEAVLAALPGTRRVGGKSFFVEACHALSQGWEAPRPGQRYRALRAGLPLANRLGPLNDIEFSEFVVKMQAVADAVGATPELPDMMHEVARARELDQFASAHDAQLTFTVRAKRASWSPGYLAQHAAACGFVAGALPGRMVLPADEAGAPAVLVLQYETQVALADDPEQQSLREFHLTLDVPQVTREQRPFVRLREVASALAQRMEGVVTDGSAQGLGPEALDRIGADLEGLYEALEARQLAAGSALARRLFS